MEENHFIIVFEYFLRVEGQDSPNQWFFSREKRPLARILRRGIVTSKDLITHCPSGRSSLALITRQKKTKIDAN